MKKIKGSTTTNRQVAGARASRDRRSLAKTDIRRAVLDVSRAQLASELAAATGTNKKVAVQFLESLNEIAYREAKKSGEFTLPGIGKLVKQNRKARMGRNPATGKVLRIPANTVVKFRVAKSAKDSVLGAKK